MIRQAQRERHLRLPVVKKNDATSDNRLFLLGNNAQIVIKSHRSGERIMKKVLSVLAVSAFVLTANSVFAGGPGQPMVPDGCPDACQQQIDDLNSSQAQQNELLSTHGSHLEDHEGRISKLEEKPWNPWYARAGVKLVWPNQLDYLSNDIDTDMGWGVQLAVGKVIAADIGAFRVELEYADQKADMSDTDGDVSLRTVMVNGAYEYPIIDMVAVYGTVGAGYGRYDLYAPVVANFTGGTSWVNHSESVFAYKGGLGVTFNIDEQMAIDLGYEYLGTSHVVINGAEINNPNSHNLVTSFRYMF